MLLHIVKLSSNSCRNSIFNVAVRSGWYKSIHTSSCIFNHYELLGVKRNASQEDIDAAYFKKMETMNVLPGFITQDLTKLLEAYETLSDKDSRLEYDSCISSLNGDNIDELVKNASEGGNLINADYQKPVLGGTRKNNKENAKLNSDQLYWAANIFYAAFIIVFVPKFIYLAYYFITSN